MSIRPVRALAVLTLASAAVAGGTLPAVLASPSTTGGVHADASPVLPGAGAADGQLTPMAPGALAGPDVLGRMESDLTPAAARRTVADLRTAMRGEAFAHASYHLFSLQAARENLPRTAELFADTSREELGDHFAKQAALVALAGGGEANLRRVLNDQDRMIEDYLVFADEARRDGDDSAAELFAEIARNKEAHRKAVVAALKAVAEGKDVDVPALPAVRHEAVAAGLPQVTSPHTLLRLNAALHDEAHSHAALLLFAEHAKDHGHPKLAAMLNGLAEVEFNDHFARLARMAGLVGATEDNLRAAIGGERYESKVVYPAFAERARAAGESRAAEVFAEAAADETKHAAAFEKALRNRG
ncbi:hypothetical protein GCM10010406_18070 [Streptomyces thermolineatus]|uniref:Ferritin-like diiron domain-containing protein n=1 Tax=Streptomyces thermolineatus TaxID=44033 RepID=A0ABN3LGQ9_9ACTN